jgi:hypothetical protein
MRVTNAIPLESTALIGTIMNYVETLKVSMHWYCDIPAHSKVWLRNMQIGCANRCGISNDAHGGEELAWQRIATINTYKRVLRVNIPLF